MNLDQIASRIADPDSCLGQDIPALKELTEKYPFAQVFSILYLKALSNQNDIGFDEALQMHAYRVTDRMKLYDLIHGRQVNELPAEARVSTDAVQLPEEVESETIPLAEIPAEAENSPEDQEVENLFPVENKEDVKIEAQETESVPETLESQEITQDPDEEAETDKRIKPEFADDELELEIISQVVAVVYNDNLENSIPEKPVEEKKSEPLINKIPAPEEGVLESRRSFSSWLKAGSQIAAQQAEEVKIDPEKEIEPAEKQVDKIINQFIEKEPSISRPKKEFYSPTKKAKESINPEGLIYTETLANIFAIQGNFPKAIIAYEQLMLTNPEKKIFFAQRIKELKEKLNT